MIDGNSRFIFQSRRVGLRILKAHKNRLDFPDTSDNICQLYYCHTYVERLELTQQLSTLSYITA